MTSQEMLEEVEKQLTGKAAFGGMYWIDKSGKFIKQDIKVNRPSKHPQPVIPGCLEGPMTTELIHIVPTPGEPGLCVEVFDNANGWVANNSLLERHSASVEQAVAIALGKL